MSNILRFCIQKQSIMTEKLNKKKMERIQEEAAKLGTSNYKFIQPFIVNTNEQIGRGSYGVVYKGADIRTSNIIAVKTISISNVKNDPEQFFSALRNEIEIMRKLQHPNIVSLYDVKQSSNYIYLFQELCEKGSLQTLLNERKKISEVEVINIAKQVVEGYKYLYEHNIIHRDIKPANILIKNQTYKIADFGLAKCYEKNTENQTIHHSAVGSPAYMSPEILNGRSYSTKSDIWSTGILIYQMLFGKIPYTASNVVELAKKVNENAIKFPEKIKNKDLQDILMKMLTYESEKRMSWKDVFEHPLFQEKEDHNIDDSIQEAEKKSKNKLQMSTKMNEIYFEDKKIIDQIETKNQSVFEQQGSISQSIKDTEKDTYNAIASKHEKLQIKQAIINRIKNWFLFKRNKAVFLNHLSLKIHSCFSLKKLNIDLIKAEMIILVLSKWQCLLAEESYLELKEGKIKSNQFSQEEFELFLNSPFREKILHKFESDYTAMKMFFNELVKKIEGYFKKHENLAKKYVKIEQICKGKGQSGQYSEIESETIYELDEICKKSLEKHKNSRELLQLWFLMKQSLKLKDDTLTKAELSMIYDLEEKLSTEELMNQIEVLSPANQI